MKSLTDRSVVAGTAKVQADRLYRPHRSGRSRPRQVAGVILFLSRISIFVPHALAEWLYPLGHQSLSQDRFLPLSKTRT